jgi:hypothetical protein
VYNSDCKNIKLTSAYSLGLSGIHFIKKKNNTSAEHGFLPEVKFVLSEFFLEGVFLVHKAEYE